MSVFLPHLTLTNNQVIHVSRCEKCNHGKIRTTSRNEIMFIIFAWLTAVIYTSLHTNWKIMQYSFHCGLATITPCVWIRVQKCRTGRDRAERKLSRGTWECDSYCRLYAITNSWNYVFSFTFIWTDSKIKCFKAYFREPTNFNVSRTVLRNYVALKNLKKCIVLPLSATKPVFKSLNETKLLRALN